MKSLRIAATAAIFSVAAVGSAATAVADLVDGSYSALFDGDAQPTTWVFTPCGADCKHLEVPASNTRTDLHLNGNTWASLTAAHTILTLDNDTLAGQLCTGGGTANEICSGYRLAKA